MYRRFTSHRRKILKEFVQGLPTFQIIQQSLERDACSSEDRRPSEDIWVLGDYLISLIQHPLSRTSIPFEFTPRGENSAKLSEPSRRMCYPLPNHSKPRKCRPSIA